MKKTFLLLMLVIIASLATGCSNKATIGSSDGPTDIIIINKDNQEAAQQEKETECETSGEDVKELKDSLDSFVPQFTANKNTLQYSPTEIHDLESAVLHMDNQDFVLTDSKSMDYLESLLSSAEELKGWPNCPYDATLYLTRKDGEMIIVYPATDSCKNFNAGDVWYEYQTETGDNTPLYGAFGITTRFGKIDAGLQTAVNDNYMLPPYKYAGDDMIEKTIVDYFEDNNYLMKPEGSVWIPAFCILREEVVADPLEGAKKGDIKVYGNFWSFVYSKQDDTLFCETGGEHPGVIYLKKNADESYEVTYFNAVGDGSLYTEDIKRISNGNTSLEKQFYDSADAGSADVKNKRTWSIYTYVKDNNLDIKYYQDYGWDPVDFEMEVNSWSNVAVEDLSVQ
ncbi:MAG: hypothetical protein Q4E54_07225 [Lachnospiraceae bacterium]|nr:hypothetical protein [Lachnospiraceae bacterium]